MANVDRNRIKDLFFKLAAFDSESFNEKKIGEYVTGLLNDLGLGVNTTDTTDSEFLIEHPESHPIIYARLGSNIQNAGSRHPILFSAHLDTVSPGISKRPVLQSDGRITSDGSTVLGADDISGLVSILEALRVITENDLEHPDIEILISPAEEPFCEGTRFLKRDILEAEYGYVLDLTGNIGTAAISAPSIISFDIEVEGKASHAGFAPEEGINALSIAAASISEIKTGRIDGQTTVNFGTIQGGTGKNIVPASVRISGEVRSLDHDKALEQIEDIFRKFEDNANKAGGISHCKKTEHILSYKTDNDDPVINRFRKAADLTGLESRLVTTFGGSDANRLNRAGIHTIVIACGMEKVHSTEEYTSLDLLASSAELTLNLMTLKEK